MPHYYCVCGSRFKRFTGGKAVKSMKLRVFISIRTSQQVTPATKVCVSCRKAYYSWSQKNPELAEAFSRVDHNDPSSTEDEDDVSTDLAETDRMMDDFLPRLLHFLLIG